MYVFPRLHHPSDQLTYACSSCAPLLPQFISKYISTIGVDFGVRPYSLPLPASTPPPPPFSLRLNFFDLSGSPHYHSIRTAFYSDAHLLLLCFDVNNRSSYERLPRWLKEADDSLERTTSAGGPLVCVCGCMAAEDSCADEQDGGEGGMSSRRRRQVTEAEARAWAERRSFLYWEVSAKTGHNVEAMFEAALGALAKRLQLP